MLNNIEMSLPGNSPNIDYVLNSNEKYTPIADNNKILIDNVATTVLYRDEAPQSSNTETFTFAIDTSGNFVDRGIMLNFEKIPLTVTLNNGATGAATTHDFHNTMFKGYKDLVMKQFGMMNAISKIDITVDGINFPSNNVSDILNMISQYYSKEEVHRYFDASQPDYLYDNRQHSEVSKGYIPSYTVQGQKFLFKNAEPALDINNPFSAVSNTEYNSRVPVFSLVEDVKDLADEKPKRIVLENTSCWLPFNILGIMGEKVPLYNVKKLVVRIELYRDWANRIFSTVPGVNTEPKYKFNNDRSTDGAILSKLYARLYTPPPAMNYDSGKPYLFEYPRVILDTRYQDVNFKANSSEMSITSTPFDMEAIPKKVYISVQPKLVTDNDYLLTNNHFCRWDQLSIELLGVRTDLCPAKSSEFLYNVCKENGLSINKQTALYTQGFPICLDISNNLGSKGDTFVGLNTSSYNGKYTLRINGSVTKLHCNNVVNNLTTVDEKVTWNNDAVTYEFKVIFVYQSYFTYNLSGNRFTDVHNISADTFNAVSGSINSLYQNFVPSVNVLGGNWFSALMPAIKSGVGRGVNVIKAIINNKDGFRDKLIKASEGAGISSNIIGGFDGHAPILGANAANWKDM